VLPSSELRRRPGASVGTGVYAETAAAMSVWKTLGGLVRRTGQALDSIGVSLQGQYAVRNERASRSRPPIPKPAYPSLRSTKRMELTDSLCASQCRDTSLCCHMRARSRSLVRWSLLHRLHPSSAT